MGSEDFSAAKTGRALAPDSATLDDAVIVLAMNSRRDAQSYGESQVEDPAELQWVKLHVVQAEHIGLNGLVVRPYNFDRQLMLSCRQIVLAQGQHAGGFYILAIKVDWAAQLLAIQRQLDDSVVRRFGQLHPKPVFPGLFHRQGQIQFVAGLGPDPPQVGVVAPLPGKAGHVLLLRFAAGLGQNLQLLALDGAFDLEGFDCRPVADALAQRRRAVRVVAARRQIPIGHARVERRTIVAVVFLDAAFERRMEGHVVTDLPTVDRQVAPAVPIVACLVVESVLEEHRTGPGVTKIILRPRAEGGRELLAINEELLVALTPPAAARVPDVQHHTHKPARAFRLQERPVNCAFGFPRQESVPMPLGVKAPQFLDRLRQRRIGHLEAHVTLNLAIVDQFDVRLLREGHVPVAVPPAILAHAHRQRVVAIHPGGGAKEITQWRPDAGCSLAVPFDLQGQLAQRFEVSGGRRWVELDAYAGDGLWAFELEDGGVLTGGRLHCFTPELLTRALRPGRETSLA